MSTTVNEVTTMQSLTVNNRTFTVRDTKAIHVDEVQVLPALFDPAAQMTEALLTRFYAPYYYASLSSAITDLNDGAVGTSVAEAEQAHDVAVYQEASGMMTVTLLNDVTLTADLLIDTACVLKLNGYTVTYSGDVSIYFQAAAGDCLVDGRVPGSKLYKTGNSQELKPMLRFAGTKGTVLGGTVEADMATVTATQYYVFAGSATPLVMDGSAVCVKVENNTSHITAVVGKNAMTLRNCRIQAESQAITYGVWKASAGHTLCMEHTDVAACSANHQAGAVIANQNQDSIAIRSCALTASTDGGSAAWAIGAYLLAQEMEVEDSSVQTGAAQGNTYGIEFATDETAAAWIRRCRIRTASADAAGDSIGVRCKNVQTHLEETEVFADSVAGGEYGIGVSASGILNVKDCCVYGARQAISIEGSCVAAVDGGLYEGSTHGGIYISNPNGQTYVHNAVLRAAKYKGQFKTSAANYAQGYMMAAVYIGGGAACSNISAYMDNCLLDGGSPVIYKDSGVTPIGCEPIRFRGSSGEQYNKIYMSNCTLQGAGKLFFANDTHNLYLGFGNTVNVQTNMPSRIDSTTCAGTVFTGHGQTNQS